MPKRKRSVESSVQAAFANHEVEIFRALKVAKGFERQRLSKRLHEDRLLAEKKRRLEREIAVLKSLDLHQTARVHLSSSLLKVKSIAASPDFPEALRTGVSKSQVSQEERIALHNVTSGLYNRDNVKQATDRAVADVCRLLDGCATDRVKRSRKSEVVGSRQEPDPETWEEKSELDGFESDVDEPGPAVGDMDSDDEAVEGTELAKYDEFLGSSDEDNAVQDPRLQGFGNTISLSASPSDADMELDADSAPSHSPLSPPAKSKTSKGKPSAAVKLPPTSLPSLMGGYVSGSESASDIDEAKPKPRRGQRARQAIWEKKYGSSAKHLQKPSRKDERDAGWDMRRGAVGENERNRKTPWKGGAVRDSLDKGHLEAAMEETGPDRSTSGSRASRAVDDLLRLTGLDKQPAQKQHVASPRTSKLKDMGSEAIYIYSTRHPDSACYMYRPEDADSDSPYEFEHVAVKVVHGFGRSAYLMAMSNEDKTWRNGIASRDSAASIESRAGRHKSSATAQHYAGGWSNHQSPDRKTTLAGHSNGEGGHDIGETIKRVLRQLQVAAERRSIFHPNDGEGGPLYLVSEQDVAQAMTLALSESERCSRSRHVCKCAKFSASTTSLPRIHSRHNAIMPSMSAAAEPATTISMPKTSFSSLSGADRRGHFDVDGTGQPTTRATVMSRQSAADIVWTEKEPLDRYSSEVDGPTRTPVYPRAHDAADCSLVPDTAVMVDRTRRNDSWTDGSQTLSLVDDASMTSFPGLPARQCTNEWLNPPLSVEQLNRASTTDLYKMGVDAHGVDAHGDGAAVDAAGLQELAVNAMSCNQTLFRGDPFEHVGAHLTSDGAGSRLPSSSVSTTEKRIGTSIGSAAHRRRSTQAPPPPPPPPPPSSSKDVRTTWHGDSPDGLLPAILDRLRKGGARMFHRPDCAGSGPGSPRAPANTPRGGERGRGMSAPSIAGLRSQRRRRSDDVCSEDYLPHVCVDEMDDGSTGVLSD
ncbi:hypothetical protein CP532_4804 [Ophiocordyceps camponoti-leonardi (nom. inval.)]|nr:hypothetical protein CP532_4804 [Ophiocordyceps camponoti-leonardi (nom. inval.)]